MSEQSKRKTITKTHLVNAISSELGMSATEVRNVIQAFLDKLTDSLNEGDRIEFRDFGVFEVVTRKAKIGRNPRKASVPIPIPSRNAVKFTPGKKMKELIEEQLKPATHKAHIPQYSL